MAPTLDHADACIRRLKARARESSGTLLCAVVMRYTGLRLRQVTGMHREDLDLKAGTLLVRHGKSKLEQAEMRVVPLSQHLLAEPLFVEAVAGTVGGRVVRCSSPASVIKAAWEDATELDGVPRYVWAPANRLNARPDHAFRAALQAHLTGERVAHDVVDFVVGHSGNLRDTHYGRELMDATRTALDGLPPIRWAVGEGDEKVVALEKARRRARRAG